MDSLTYASEIIKLNQTKIGGYRDVPGYYAHVCFGLIEELCEWAFEIYRDSNPEQTIKEAGDVLAYASLVYVAQYAQANEPIPSVLSNVEKAAQSLSVFLDDCRSRQAIDESVIHHVLALASQFKRWHREQQIPDIEVVRGALAFVLTEMGFYEVGFEKIAAENIGKLTGRLERGTLFKGMGDNR